MIKIVVDLQGADRKPAELMGGALRALEENSDLFLYLCGDAREIDACLKDKQYDHTRLEVVDAPQVITNTDDPAQAFQTKPDSSLIQGMELCKQDPHIGGFVSCGATGAIFVSAMMLLGRIGRISPMLLTELRKRDGSPFCIVDCGANVDCRAEKLVDFARMGVAYMKAVGIQQPKVGLLSNGAEDGKGNAVTKKANGLLRQSGLNFLGNVEGNHILDGEADVIACEGFAGNILLKTIEGSAKTVIAQWEDLARDLPEQEKASTMQIARRLYQEYDYNSQGGAVLLGVNVPVVKGHGAADEQTVFHIIRMASRLAKNNLIESIKKEFAI